MSHLLSRNISIFLLLFFINFHISQAQTSSVSKDELLFQKGMLLQQLADEQLGFDEVIRDRETDETKSAYASELKEIILEEAGTYFQEVIDSFPDSKNYYGALSHQASIKLELQDTVEAEKMFLTVLNSKISDKDSAVMVASSNYKNRAAKMLGEISLADRLYQKALAYLEEAKKFKRQYTSVNSQEDDNMHFTVLFAKCYIGLKQYQKAYDLLLPKVLKNDLADNSELVEVTYEALLKKYKREDLKKKYELSFQNYKVEKAIKKEEDDRYFIIFLNKKIEFVFDSPPQNAAEARIMVDEVCKNLLFYKYLKEEAKN